MRFPLTISGSHPVEGDYQLPRATSKPGHTCYCTTLTVFVYVAFPLVDCEQFVGHGPRQRGGALCFVKGDKLGCQIVMSWGGV